MVPRPLSFSLSYYGGRLLSDGLPAFRPAGDAVAIVSLLLSSLSRGGRVLYYQRCYYFQYRLFLINKPGSEFSDCSAIGFFLQEKSIGKSTIWQKRGGALRSLPVGHASMMSRRQPWIGASSLKRLMICLLRLRQYMVSNNTSSSSPRSSAKSSSSLH